jgi:hypothetical protein
MSARLVKLLIFLKPAMQCPGVVILACILDWETLKPVIPSAHKIPGKY